MRYLAEQPDWFIDTMLAHRREVKRLARLLGDPALHGEEAERDLAAFQGERARRDATRGEEAA